MKQLAALLLLTFLLSVDHIGLAKEHHHKKIPPAEEPQILETFTRLVKIIAVGEEVTPDDAKNVRIQVSPLHTGISVAF